MPASAPRSLTDDAALMETTTIGRSKLGISRLGYGGWALSGRGWSGVNEREARATAEAALEAGVTFFDTAPVYGFGRSEEILGEVLKGSNAVIASKCGLVWDRTGRVEHSLTRDSIFRSLESSLKRLKTDRIDLYQIHWPDPATPLKETMDALSELVQQGVVREIGVCNFSPEELESACCLGEVASYQGAYNYLQRNAEEKIIPQCRDRKIAFLSYSSLAQGLLGGDCREGYKPTKNDIRRFNPLFSDEALFSSSLNEVSRLGKKPAREALRFIAQNDGVTSMLVSMTKRKHLDENLSAFS
jgi:aryl-alcohol dehydrogenase-like predicted oxidoreductase